MPNSRSKSLTSIFFAALGVFIVPAAWSGDIVLSLEEPVPNSTYTGVANIRGWVVGSAGISRIELFVDGELKTNIPVGGRRSDVGTAYPSYPDSSNSGFSMAFNYSNLTASQHTIRVRAIDKEGVSKDVSAAFNTTRFDNPFISNPSSVSFNGATGSFGSQSIIINNMTADGKTYDIRLDWRTAIQGYAITQIIPTGSQSPITDFSGTWEYTASLARNTCATAVPNDYRNRLQLSQSGTRLSGTDVGVSFPISGSVDAQGHFLLSSPINEQGNAACKTQGYNAYEGNFIGLTITQSVNIRTVGNCPESVQCAITYQGTLKKVSNSTASANQDSAGSDSRSPVEAGLQGLLNGLIKPIEIPKSPQ